MSLNTMFDLKDRICLVTGGGTGIGLHIARGLASHGAKVYITGRRQETLEKAASAWKNESSNGGVLIPLQMDATSKDSILKARDVVAKEDGKLHFLVNNAGQTGPVSEFLNNTSAPEHKDPETLGRALFNNESFETWSDLYKINTFSVFFVTTAFLGLLDVGSNDVPGWTSSVVNVTSVSGTLKIAQCHFAYNSAKAAASHLTKMMSTEFALKNINVRVNAISPGVYATEMTIPVNTPEDVQTISQALVPVPSRRAGTEEEVAGTAVYLASRAGGYVFGQEIVVDGGYVAVNPATT
ncbi:NAD(P)-binding protein [Punctularia strigosozonata HHB-11173 SS5]|uniref:NAD(P)-binding protein n=1 Tax=Punctularia strigosozonata (strain HHB-11173) TaxID=741275 RepID=UPI000441646B|nr:NAD(P)-binding protein [Punctularia strigosozonata HHB-11173 SS5]EIN12539.1 NAD(P)-binding protein [Punctularia strigosozonata HHB-11173 SS5]